MYAPWWQRVRSSVEKREESVCIACGAGNVVCVCVCVRSDGYVGMLQHIHVTAAHARCCPCAV